MANLHTTTPGSRGKVCVSRASADAFMGKLFDPLPDAELHDPELKRLEDKARRQEQKDREGAWYLGWLKVQAAVTLFHALMAQNHLDRHTGKSVEGCRVADEDAACRAMHKEWKRQMLVPVASAANLNWKRKHLFADSPFGNRNDTPAVMQALEVDELYLAQRKGGKQS